VPDRDPSMAVSTGEEAAFRPYPSKLFVETTTHCNLLCPMCVKQAADSRVIDGDLSQATFAALEPAFPHLESLVLNGIGEPLMHPQLLEWVARARQEMPDNAWIGFQSNGLLLEKPIAQFLVAAGLDRICLSVDGVSPDTFSKVREGESLSDMERAFAVLAETRRAQPGNRLRVGAEFVTMRENFRQLPDTVRWVAERGADFFIVSQTLPYDPASVQQTTYHNASEAAIELFDKWKKQLADMDLDIRLYNYMSWERERVLKRSVDPRIVEVNKMVNRMRNEARKTDVFLDVIQMLQRDTALQAEVEDIYGRAQRVADEMGIELKLPVITPLAERKCDFVTGGSAFISWYGGVHPCYYLWHQYRCYINDWDRLIKVKEFGNVNERPLLEIWNDDEFKTFRRNVVEFDYPYCANCSVAPCDLVQEEDFVHDCFANNEPCSTCQWAMGLLQCLQ
jgi:putative metalloenzyme radical SAM/SPASM domain maturase